MSYFLTLALLLTLSSVPSTCQPRDVPAIKLTAPTYYLAVQAQRSEPSEIHFRGASNLPAQSEVDIQVSIFYQGGWKEYSNTMCIAVDQHGFFEGDIHPKDGMKFENNLVLRAVFETQLCHQPASTLQAVGKHGEHLTGLNEQDASYRELGTGRSPNPQVFQVSGWYYGLEVIARVLTGGSWPTK